MTASPSPDKTQPRNRNQWWSLSVVSLGTFMVTTDIGLLSIALPVIMTELRADLELAAWITLIYALVTASLYLPSGRLSDLVGRSKVYRLGFLLYAVTSLVAGFAQTGGQLIFFRGLQAVGSALIMTNSFALVTALFPPEARGRAMGIAGGSVAALGYTLGPVIGGVLTYSFGWRSNFFVTALLSSAGFLAARTILGRDRDDSSPRLPTGSFDVAGALSSALGIAALLLALTTGQKGARGTAVFGAELGVAAFSLSFFIWWQTRVADPLLDLKLFRNPAFALGNAARLISFIAISLSSLIMPLFLQLALGVDPLRAGLLVAPTPLALALLAPLTGWLSDRVAPRILCTIGLAVKGFALAALSGLSAGANSLDIALRLGLLGLGLGIFQTPNNNSLMSSLPRDRLGVGSSFLSIVRSLGHSTGAALATAILSARLLAITGETSLQDLAGGGAGSLSFIAFMEGFRTCYLAAAILCLAGAVITALPAAETRR
jgi:EmrB/QacA subfamily drug resistance transporter